MTEDQIKHMVDRFLAWRLPDNFNPDNGITFQPVGNPGTRRVYLRNPVGTNLLDAYQAKGMIRHLVEGLPDSEAAHKAEVERLTGEITRVRIENERLNGSEFFRSCLEAKRENDALRAEVAALKAEREWRPIETAKLGEMVLLRQRAWRHPFPGKRIGDNGLVWVDTCESEARGWQTHADAWMPLPTPPTETNDD